MPEFKPTKPGWYWLDIAGIYQPAQVETTEEGLVMYAVVEWQHTPWRVGNSDFLNLAPVVPLEDGPGVNAVQRQCLETALQTTTLEYCLLGLAGESGEAVVEAYRKWQWESRDGLPKLAHAYLQEFVVGASGCELLKKAIRAGDAPALPLLPDECKSAIAKELTDVLWYALVGLDRCGVSASQAFEQLRIKLQARKEAGTLAATTKREGE